MKRLCRPNPQTTPTPLPETENSTVVSPEATPTETPAENNQQSQVSKTQPPNSETVTKTEPTSKPFFEPIIIDVRRKGKSETESGTDPTEIGKSKPKKPNRKILIRFQPDCALLSRINLKTEETPNCELVASQESVWLVNDGGSLGILVGFAGQGEAEKITAVSSSPADVEVSLEPEIGANSGRAFFILKSISAKKGAFTVTFNSPCGKKEVQVRVR